MNKIELLAPAGDLEKLKFALHYGADAVYIGGQIFGLRAAAKNFSYEDMKTGIDYAHQLGKKVYLTLNIIPHNEDIEALKTYVNDIRNLQPDAVILSDPGTLMFVREMLPEMEIHLSTQANNTNYMSAKFWHTQGVKRVILARELSLEEIKDIKDNIPDTLQLEAFIHGAMCISYSGRCLLSNYLNGRDANRGACSQPCRWEYFLVEKTRPGEYYPIIENDEGTFFFNSKDLCMIEHIPELVHSGLDSLKIEGRMKSVYYVANVVRAYREALDTYYKSPETFKYNGDWFDEIRKASHREFTKGFYYNKPTHIDQHYTSSSYVREYDFIGVVLAYDPVTKMAEVEQRNHFKLGDQVEVMGPEYFLKQFEIDAIYNDQGEAIDKAPHAQQIIKIPVPFPVAPLDILRKPREV